MDNFRMTSAWYNTHHQQDVGYYPHSARLLRDKLCLLPFSAPQIPSTPDNPIDAGPGQITAQPNVDNTIQGCPCLICSRARYNHQLETGQGTTEYQDSWAPASVVRTIYYSTTAPSPSNWNSSPRSRLSRMRTKTLVVAIHTASLLPWAVSHRHGLSPPQLWWVARSSVLCVCVNSSSRRIKKTPGGHLCRRQ